MRIRYKAMAMAYSQNDIAISNMAQSMAQTMLWAMLLMALAFWLYAIAIALYRIRTLILEREKHTLWVEAELRPEGAS